MITATPNVLIGTPAYGGMVHTDFVHTIIGIQRAGIPFALLSIANESLITRARNSLLSKFHELRDYTHLLFLDGDIFVSGEDIARLIAYGKEVIGAPVPLKGHTPEGRAIYNTGRALRQDGELVVSDYIGTAVLLLSRRAADALVADAEEHNRVYTPNPYGRGETEGQRQYDVFQVGVVEGVYLSEDFWMCRRLRELGFDIYVAPGIPVRHQGVTAFGG